ncbi:hypothetical protein PhCBS80983_g03323 [Powellomyces hirtus]|uniref:DUF1206 domain-containing protein n=1 Tax=Powellomyces hirtus TaxID=109895 RepID=A0A507E299_9FUNG|nr:hypothetical protein PhCBS80983_g03323 [Powellomyces hirtus]
MQLPFGKKTKKPSTHPEFDHHQVHGHHHTVATAHHQVADETGCFYCLHRLKNPHGVSPRWKRVQRIVGRIGFGAKGVVYGTVGGMTCASASKLHGNFGNSPQGAFVLIGNAPSGTGALFVMLLALWCYAIWRFWEFLTYQGRDATFGAAKNFFRFRLSPLVSGCVYITYSYYIIQMLLDQYRDREPSCYPNCWRESTVGKVALILMGVAFVIACITQLQNALTKKWHSEIKWQSCKTAVEKWALLALGHLGFLGRAGIFLFVGVLMFKALKRPVKQSGDALSDGLAQLLDGSTAGLITMWITGILTVMYGVFCLLCTRYRQFPTPPPSGQPYISNRSK